MIKCTKLQGKTPKMDLLAIFKTSCKTRSESEKSTWPRADLPITSHYVWPGSHKPTYTYLLQNCSQYSVQFFLHHEPQPWYSWEFQRAEREIVIFENLRAHTSSAGRPSSLSVGICRLWKLSLGHSFLSCAQTKTYVKPQTMIARSRLYLNYQRCAVLFSVFKEPKCWFIAFNLS